MGFKDKVTSYYTQSYLKKYGDRLTQVNGNVISVKVEQKSILGIFHKLVATLLVRPERSKAVVKCVYKKNRWFKKPEFMNIYQGNLVIIQGLKSKKSKKGKKANDNKEWIQISNVRNLSTKQDLVPVEGAPKVQRVRQKYQRMK